MGWKPLISAAKTLPVRRAVEPRLSKQRSRVSNGAGDLPDVDKRSSVARRFRDIVSQVCVDLGGADRLSEARLQLIRRFAACSVLAEQLEARLARNETVDVSEHSQLSSTLTRLVQRIGINRVAKTVPTLGEYLATKGIDQE